MRSSSSGVERNAPASPTSDAGAGFSPEWKQEANHRLAAHRARRGGGRMGLQNALPGMEEEGGERAGSGAPAKGKNVADRVAARYAQAPTYSEMLAAEARNAARAAENAAVAAGEARDAAQAILAGLDVSFAEASSENSAEQPGSPANRPASVPDQRAAKSPAPWTSFGESSSQTAIAEAQNPQEEEAIIPVQPLPAKLLEFPRELVATRKARPRLAEGPLREEHEGQPQLRIFEVESEAISTEPVLTAALPGWSAIRLDSHPASAPGEGHLQNAPLPAAQLPSRPQMATQYRSTAEFDLPIQSASLEDRLMAAVVDAALIVAGFLLFVLVFSACTAHPPVGKVAVVGAALSLFAFAAVYQVLFFNFGHDTPGMRYAKIALCTFEDNNPTRKAKRRRMAALLLSASPLGLGILWAFFDHDRLGWHDRISRTYQRSYR